MPVSEHEYVELTVQLEDSSAEELLREINEYTERLRVEREVHEPDREWIHFLT